MTAASIGSTLDKCDTAAEIVSLFAVSVIYVVYLGIIGRMNYQAFQELLWQKATELYRPMPWRETITPYYVLVSELMLQQTQVERVIPKFLQFVEAFPTIHALAKAPLSDVLILWSGLGYNRRAKFLHRAAQLVIQDYEGVIPQTKEALIALPGVGENTAGAILAYAFNEPVIFVETNVRTVYIHHFFRDVVDVDDTSIRGLLAETIDAEHPREFYWALMDYGSYLKRQGTRNIDQSKHYKKQSTLKGSVREVRGLILKELSKGVVTESELREKLPQDERYLVALDALIREGFIERRRHQLLLAQQQV
jgi:A/G-specific adenine glycosylase